MPPPLFDVVVVGAGLSGLMACDILSRHDKELTICLVEARDRIGGRVETHEDGFDLGAGWIGPTHKELLGLIHRYPSLHLVDQYYPTTTTTATQQRGSTQRHQRNAGNTTSLETAARPTMAERRDHSSVRHRDTSGRFRKFSICNLITRRFDRHSLYIARNTYRQTEWRQSVGRAQRFLPDVKFRARGYCR